MILIVSNSILFGVGYLYNEEKNRHTIVYSSFIVPAGEEKGNNEMSGRNVVASKNGTKYYFTWCGGVSRIKESNKVWFKSITDAQKAGYEPSSQCKGL